jgi:hypothetical protein
LFPTRFKKGETVVAKWFKRNFPLFHTFKVFARKGLKILSTNSPPPKEEANNNNNNNNFALAGHDPPRASRVSQPAKPCMHLSVFGSKLSGAFQPVVSRIVVAMTLYPCPPGHHVLELADIEVGRQVTYISRDASMPQIITTIVEGMVLENDCVALKHKKHAAMNRVFVPVSAVGEFDPPADGTACASVVDEGDMVNDADVDDFLHKDVALPLWMQLWMQRFTLTNISGRILPL